MIGMPCAVSPTSLSAGNEPFRLAGISMLGSIAACRLKVGVTHGRKPLVPFHPGLANDVQTLPDIKASLGFHCPGVATVSPDVALFR